MKTATRPLAVPSLDTRHHYTTPTGEAVCRIRLYRRGTVVVVVATELPDNPGMSVTNAAEILASDVYHRYCLVPRNTIWIEHYPRGAKPMARTRETFDLVLFVVGPSGGLSAPDWQRLEMDEVERWIGGAWEPESEGDYVQEER